MTKGVMISINPVFVRAIEQRIKTLEVRKNMPKLEVPFRCFIYCTANGSGELLRDVFRGDLAAWNNEKWGERKGKVVGEFVCDQIECVDIPYPAFQGKLDKRYGEQSCVRYYDLHRYVYHDAAYFWHITDLKMYEHPNDLSDFKPWSRECKCSDLGLAIPDCWTCHACKMERPPQSWCYVDITGDVI